MSVKTDISNEHLDHLYKKIWERRENASLEEIVALSEGACSKKTREDYKYRIRFVILNLIPQIAKNKLFYIIQTSNYNFAILYEDYDYSLTAFKGNTSDEELDLMIKICTDNICKNTIKMHNYKYWYRLYCIDNEENNLGENLKYKTNVQKNIDIQLNPLYSNSFEEYIFDDQPNIYQFYNPDVVKEFGEQFQQIEDYKNTPEPVETYHPDIEKYRKRNKNNTDDFIKECYSKL